MAKVEVRLFAILRELAGAGSIALEFSGDPTVGELIEKVLSLKPGLGAMLMNEGKFNERFKVLVGRELVFPEDFSRVRVTGRIAILPPVSGG